MLPPLPPAHYFIQQVAIVEFDAMVTEDGIVMHKAAVERDMAADDTLLVYTAVISLAPRTERKGALDIDGVQSTLTNPAECLEPGVASNRYGALSTVPLCIGCGSDECERLNATCDKNIKTTGLPRRGQRVDKNQVRLWPIAPYLLCLGRDWHTTKLHTRRQDRIHGRQCRAPGRRVAVHCAQCARRSHRHLHDRPQHPGWGHAAPMAPCLFICYRPFTIP